MRRVPATALLVLGALLQPGCGSSSHSAGPTTAATSTATTTAPTTTRDRPKPAATIATTTVALPPPSTTTRTTTSTRTTTKPATTTTTSTTVVVQQALCPSEQGAGIVAVFGHRATTTEAEALVAKVGTVGFGGLVVQRRGCHDYAVVLPNLKSLRQGRELQREARSVDMHVLIECRSHPVQGGLAAVFGHRHTRRAAVRLLRQAEHVGFQNLQVQEDSCNDWEVDLYGLQTPGQRRDLAKEAASVGFHLTFEPG